MAPRGKRRAVRPRAPSVVPRWYAALGLVALATAAFGIVHGRDVADATSTPTVVHHVRSPLTINGTAALAPDPADEQPQLSAEAAWSRYEQQTGGSRPTVPVGTTVYLGLFTQASVVDRLSYVFRLPTSLGCTAVHPTASPTPTAAATASPTAQCRTWVVVDANTGHQVAEEQEIQVPTS